MTIFGNPLFTTQTSSSSENTNFKFLFGNGNSEKKRTNAKFLTNQKPFGKCNHFEKYCAFCPKEGIGLICYDCIYEYDLKDCIPLKKNIDYYKEISINYINEIKNVLKNKLINKLDEFFKAIEIIFVKSNNFDSLLKKLDINFGLPIEIPFEDRIKIGINKRISKFKNIFSKEIELDNLINIYESKLEDLKIKLSYPSINEIIEISSRTPFTLKGFGIPKISKEIINNIKISYQQTSGNIFGKNNNNSTPRNIEFTIEEKDDLSLIKFDDSIDIDSNYSIFTFEGISGISYIDNENEFITIHNNIDFSSRNQESIIACILV